MKMALHISIFSVLLACMACNGAIAANCQEHYYSPDDYNHEHTLAEPHPELLKSLKPAKAGNAVEQRNMAVSYDAGYLVSACPEKARYWYRKAARNGDQIARDWVARDNKFKEMLEGPEFAVRMAPPPAFTPAPAIRREALTPAAPAAAANAAASRGQNPDAVIKKYTEFEQADPTSEYRTLIKAGQFLGDFLNKFQQVNGYPQGEAPPSATPNDGKTPRN